MRSISSRPRSINPAMFRGERLGGVLGLKFSGYVLPELRRGTAAGKVGMPLGTYIQQTPYLSPYYILCTTCTTYLLTYGDIY